jgi:hypothetical protein
MVEWGGHHGGWGGFGPPSYIVKKCPAVNSHFTNKNSYQSDALFTLCIDLVFGGKYWYMVNDIIARYHLKLTLTKLS